MAHPGQPSAITANGRPASRNSPLPSVKLENALNTIKEEFHRIWVELESLRDERDRMQGTATAQNAEISLIKRSVYELEKLHSHQRQRYEDDAQQLREELALLRASMPNPHSLTSSSSMQPGAMILHSHHTNHTSNSVIRGPESINQREQVTAKSKTRYREEFDCEYDLNQHMSKRIKSNEGGKAVSLSEPESNAPQFPPRTQVHIAHGNSSDVQVDGKSNQRPPLHPSTAFHLLEDFSLANVPPEFRKEFRDWSVVYNPRIPRSFDVNVVHTIAHDSVVCSVHFSPDGRYLATGCNRMTFIYDVKSGAEVCHLVDRAVQALNDLYIRSVRFSPDGAQIATGAEDHKVRVWDISSRTLRHTFEGHAQEIYALDFTKDGKSVISGSGDCTARLWDLSGNNNKTYLAMDGENGIPNVDSGVTSVSVSSNNCFLAAGCLDSSIRVWNILTGHLVARLQGHAESVYSVKFMPTGMGLLSGSLDKLAKFWDLSVLLQDDAQKQPIVVQCPIIADLKGHQDYVLAVNCSDNGQWIASGSKDRSMMLWDSKSRSAIFKLHGHKNSVISIDIHHGFIATGSGDTCCRIWKLVELV